MPAMQDELSTPIMLCKLITAIAKGHSSVVALEPYLIKTKALITQLIINTVDIG